jgi:hypothetical protein
VYRARRRDSICQTRFASTKASTARQSNQSKHRTPDAMPHLTTRRSTLEVRNSRERRDGDATRVARDATRASNASRATKRRRSRVAADPKPNASSVAAVV